MANTEKATLKVTKQTQAKALSAHVRRDPPKLRFTEGMRSAALASRRASDRPR